MQVRYPGNLRLPSILHLVISFVIQENINPKHLLFQLFITHPGRRRERHLKTHKYQRLGYSAAITELSVFYDL